MKKNIKKLTKKHLLKIEKEGLYRKPIEIKLTQHGKCLIKNNEYICFSSNDYLGLSIDFHEPTDKSLSLKLTGSTGSRLLSGTHLEHNELEINLENKFNSDGALIFNSGYHENTGIIPAITDSQSIIFSDEKNHASIIDGCRLSKSLLVIYKHNDITDLLNKIKQVKSDGLLKNNSHNLVITESVFSMNGDIPDLNKIFEICKEYNLLFYLDEAHGFGVFGKNGLGASEVKSIKPDIYLGTFGKSAGVFGAFCICGKEMKQFLLNTARTFIYSTSLPPLLVSLCNKNLNIITSNKGQNLRDTLFTNINCFVNELAKLNIKPECTQSQIIPILIGNEHKAVLIADHLFKNNIFCRVIRYPTVPKNKAMLRFSLSAAHSQNDLIYTANKLEQII